ncbi:MAG: hypothetical protein A4E53_03668 [Pelotomaculum sp. PtaB.Bin104]|nr:MAG: hypothetical protein A4E53_03668 [Pelotomaculum sp. PtaB.Bin104]
MYRQTKDYTNDYRVNFLNNGSIISVEVKCCGKHIGEVRFKDGETKKCPYCGAEHMLKLQHNHFHIRSFKAAAGEATTRDDTGFTLKEKAL